MAATRWARRLAVTWILLVLLASVVDPSGLLAGGGSGAAGPGVDTWAHLAGYAVLAWVLAAAFGGSERRGALLAVVVASAVGVGAELLQAPIPTRTASVADAVANAVGAVVGAASRTAWRARGQEESRGGE
ncbi:MAG: VanZ family protein [Halobellus sp.]